MSIDDLPSEFDKFKRCKNIKKELNNVKDNLGKGNRWKKKKVEKQFNELSDNYRENC